MIETEITQQFSLASQPRSENSSYLPFDALTLIQKFGATETITGNNGERITVLPSCEVPLTYLQPDNWMVTTGVGNCRSVRSIDRLKNGDKPKLYIKSPERIYTGEKSELDRGTIWWGGPRSGQKKILFNTHPLIEEQSEWEAAMLLTLNANGIKAEKPQAILTYPDGKKIVIVREINKLIFSGNSHKGPSYQTMLNHARKIGMIPDDATEYNCLGDEQGYNTIIDVNRWEWPPFTNEYRKKLLSFINSIVVK
jgi:hypothetical protein